MTTKYFSYTFDDPYYGGDDEPVEEAKPNPPDNPDPKPSEDALAPEPEAKPNPPDKPDVEEPINTEVVELVSKEVIKPGVPAPLPERLEKEAPVEEKIEIVEEAKPDSTTSEPKSVKDIVDKVTEPLNEKPVDTKPIADLKPDTEKIAVESGLTDDKEPTKEVAALVKPLADVATDKKDVPNPPDKPDKVDETVKNIGAPLADKDFKPPNLPDNPLAVQDKLDDVMKQVTAPLEGPSEFPDNALKLNDLIPVIANAAKEPKDKDPSVKEFSPKMVAATMLSVDVIQKAIKEVVNQLITKLAKDNWQIKKGLLQLIDIFKDIKNKEPELWKKVLATAKDTKNYERSSIKLLLVLVVKGSDLINRVLRSLIDIKKLFYMIIDHIPGPLKFTIKGFVGTINGFLGKMSNGKEIMEGIVAIMKQEPTNVTGFADLDRMTEKIAGPLAQVAAVPGVKDLEKAVKGGELQIPDKFNIDGILDLCTELVRENIDVRALLKYVNVPSDPKEILDLPDNRLTPALAFDPIGVIFPFVSYIFYDIIAIRVESGKNGFGLPTPKELLARFNDLPTDQRKKWGLIIGGCVVGLIVLIVLIVVISNASKKSSFRPSPSLRGGRLRRKLTNMF